MRERDTVIIAGHCSFTPDHKDEYWEIADIQTPDGSEGRQRAVWGARCVGIKSRTDFNPDGNGMGIDFNSLIKVLEGSDLNIVPPSVAFAREFCQKTGLAVASEITTPHIQMPWYERKIPKDKFLAWNPSVDQLGWNEKQIAIAAGINGWLVGIKNGKWENMEKTWKGLATYAKNSVPNDKIILIHRGIGIEIDGFRNAPVHETAETVKKATGLQLFLDPSHICGPDLRDQIVEKSIEWMSLKTGNGWLYDGLLIEAGTSETDTAQHISIDELRCLAEELAKFRKLKPPESSGSE